MLKPRFFAFLLAVVAPTVLTAGCRQDDPLADLIADSPFRDPLQQRSTKEVLLVTCQFQALEVPGHVAVTDFPFWPAAQANSSDAPPLSPQLVDRWRANGLIVAAAPIEHWPSLRQGIVDAAGLMWRQGITTFRSAAELAEFPAYPNEKATPVFVFDAHGSPQGFTAPPGDCLFRMTCVPRTGLPSETDMRIKIVPLIAGTRQKHQFVKDQHRLRRVQHSPEIVFQELMLDAVIPTGYFICIAALPQATGPESLGERFLLRKRDGKNYQQIVVLVPEMRRVQPAAAATE